MTSKDFQGHVSKITDNVVPVGIVAFLLFAGMQIAYFWGGSDASIDERVSRNTEQIQRVRAEQKEMRSALRYVRSALVRVETRLGTLPDEAWQRWDQSGYGTSESDSQQQ